MKNISITELVVLGALAFILIGQGLTLEKTERLFHETELITFVTPENTYYLQGKTVTDLEGRFPSGGIVCRSRMEAIQFAEEMQTMELERNFTGEAPSYEYNVNIDPSGYTIYGEDNYVIGFVPYGQCPRLDGIFTADNL